ncbi:right-handed parallel beta-helix repeat-containing protein [Parapedobacter tibetensis]|uniref:right-handed parallel beta-helix repeat-containing protein n=1 Tax=Parapedobacter tibetensis TaxID=2972951 RepID=UPI00214DD27B|nr:right-handed parallel beta-helix repeat-containing protein [Parapedobacter tibetensis]
MKRYSRRQFVAAAAAGPLMATIAGTAVRAERKGHLEATPCQQPTFMKVNNRIFGAKPDDRGDIGGFNYTQTFTKGNYLVQSPESLIETLSKAKAGDVVFIPSAIIIDLTTFIYIDGFVLEIPQGVTLAGDRGYNGSEGALLCSDVLKTKVMIRAAGPNVRITGLRIQGPNSKRHSAHHRRAFGPDGQGSEYYYKFPVSSGIESSYDGLEIDNCEITAFSHSAIRLGEGVNHHIHHNYIHHCQYHGLGYGIAHIKASSLIEYNLFDSNRHSIAGTGVPGCSYTARNNVECGVSLSHCFDMHGGRDRKDNTDIAGTSIKIYNNTFRAPQYAVAIRGEPEEACEVFCNWFSRHTEAAKAVLGYERTHVYDNLYGTGNSVVK